MIVNGITMCQNDNPTHDLTTEFSCTINLQANTFYTFEAWVLDVGGGEQLFISWEYPGQSKQEVPSKYFWYGNYIGGNPKTVNDCTSQCTKCKNKICDVCNSGYMIMSVPNTATSQCFSECGAGKYRDVTNPSVCQNCPADTYSSKVNSQDTNDCLPCADGQYALSGSSSCSKLLSIMQKMYGGSPK